jgi:hypothetical protein
VLQNRAVPSYDELDGATVNGADAFDGADCADTNVEGEARDEITRLASFMETAQS